MCYLQIHFLSNKFLMQVWTDQILYLAHELKYRKQYYSLM